MTTEELCEAVRDAAPGFTGDEPADIASPPNTPPDVPRDRGSSEPDLRIPGDDLTSLSTHARRRTRYTAAWNPDVFN